jgi:AAHS family 4-hydroxybenzoate transporter-like MFS transporter
MSPQRKLEVQAFIDEQRFSGFHIRLFVLCFLIIGLDGLDTGAMGYLVPSLIKDWNVSRAVLGPVLSATLVGIGIGAMLVSPVADRIGRKRVLIGSVFVFGAFTVAAAFATSLEMLTVMRFLTGVGLGAAVPNTVTLMAEYVPTRIRGTVVNSMLVGFALGNATGGLMTAWLIPHFGWRSVLIFGGVLPVLLSLILIRMLPESVKFLVANQRGCQEAIRILRRIAPGAKLDDVALVCEEDLAHGRKSPISELFVKRYAVGTSMLWLCYFMCMMILYLVNNWLPTLFTVSGFSLHDSTITATLFHIGGCAGILLAGLLTDRFPPTRVVASYFLVAAGVVLVINHHVSQGSGLTMLIIIMGVAVSGAAASMSPLAAHYYPTTSRVTGVAWMLGIGRFGGVAGTLGGAMLLGIGWDFGAIFSLLAIPAVIAALSLLVLGRNEARQGQKECVGSPAAEY